MTVDFKKTEKAFYALAKNPQIIDIPEMNFVMADGKGNPNTSSEYANAVGCLYGLIYTVKMSKMSGDTPKGYFDFVVPPLESLWWIVDKTDDFSDKDKYCWTAMLRLPDFVSNSVFDDFKQKLSIKKPELDLSVIRPEKFTEGLVGQITHIGSYDDEPATNKTLKAFYEEQGYILDLSDKRRHHELYFNDPRKTPPEKLKTIIRQPIKKVKGV